MKKVIADNIINAAKQAGVEAGQAKYRSYFINYPACTWYKAYKAEVDARLKAAGFESCIVTE